MITRTLVDGKTVRIEMRIQGNADALAVALAGIPASQTGEYPWRCSLHRSADATVMSAKIYLTANDACEVEWRGAGPLCLTCVPGSDPADAERIEPLMVEFAERVVARASEVEPLIGFISEQIDRRAPALLPRHVWVPANEDHPSGGRVFTSSLVTAVLGMNAEIAEVREKIEAISDCSPVPEPTPTEPRRGIAWPWPLRRRDWRLR